MRERGLRFCSERACASCAVEALTMGWSEKERESESRLFLSVVVVERISPFAASEQMRPNLKFANFDRLSNPSACIP